MKSSDEVKCTYNPYSYTQR